MIVAATSSLFGRKLVAFKPVGIHAIDFCK